MDAAKSRGSNFTGAELNQLCASWMHVSQDPIVGSAQKNGAFWDRTVAHYNQNRPRDQKDRNVRSLETKWSELKWDVAKFSGCYASVVDAHRSGENDEDTIKRAKDLYVTKEPKAKEFVYVDQWGLLKDCRRFAMTVGDAAQRAARLKARKPKGKGRNSDKKENDCPNVDTIVDLTGDDIGGDDRRQSGLQSEEIDRESLHAGERRPVGNKTAKKQRADESSNRMMALAQRDMAEISHKRLKMAEAQERKELFSMRLADLDDEDCWEYFRLCRAKELRIAMLKLQREQEEEERGLRRPATRREQQVPESPRIDEDHIDREDCHEIIRDYAVQMTTEATADYGVQVNHTVERPNLSFTAQLAEVELQHVNGVHPAALPSDN